MDEDMDKERNADTDKDTDEARIFLSSRYAAVRTFHRLFHAAEDATITPDQIYTEFERDPHRADSSQWLFNLIRPFRDDGLVEATHYSTSGPKGGSKGLKNFRLTSKGKEALERHREGLRREEELRQALKRYEAQRQGKTITQEASETQTAPAPSETPENETFTVDAVVDYVTQWHKQCPSFGVTLEISLESGVVLAIRLKGKGQK